MSNWTRIHLPCRDIVDEWQIRYGQLQQDSYGQLVAQACLDHFAN